MIHAKFQDNGTASSGVDDFKGFYHTAYGHGGHLGHVTKMIYINFPSAFLRRLHRKFGIDWPSVFREEDV